MNSQVAQNRKFKLGEWTVEPALDRISRGRDRLNLRPQVMDILVYLAHHQRKVVSADELLERVWQGRVVTTASIYTALNQLREALGDDAQHPKYIKTVPRRGYRLIADVEFLEEQEKAQPGFVRTVGVPAQPGSRDWRPLTYALAGFVLAIYLLANFRAQIRGGSPHPGDITPVQSVAVLPFTDLSPEHDYDWFGDGIAEEILNRLAQVPGLKVTGRASSFAFRETDAPIQSIGRTLGVAHLLEGSVRRDGDHLRVTAQLSKASDGFRVWSQEYDREVTEILAIQDDIATNIAAVLKLKLAAGSQAGAATTRSYYPDFTAYELYLQARDLMERSTGESLVGALEKLQRAVELDPGLANAHLALAETYQRLYQSLSYYDGDGIEESRARMRPHLEEALAIDPNLAQAYVIQTWMVDDGSDLELLNKAIALNPNLASAHRELGATLAAGLFSWNEVIAHMDRALALDPLSFDNATLLVQFLRFLPQRRDDALDIIENLKQRHPGHATVIWLEGDWLLQAGRVAEAIPLLERATVADPDTFFQRGDLVVAWFSLGETGRAMESHYPVNQWRLVLAPDRDESLRQLRETEYAGGPMDFSYSALDAYVYLMLHDWKGAVHAMEPYLGDLEGFLGQCAMECGRNYSPALSLATAYRVLGEEEGYRDFLALEQEAVDIRSDNGRIHNVEYSRAMARIDALEGRPYEAMLELERLVTTGPLDPRELLHPAFDELRDDPRFARLQNLQRERVNAERAKLGLSPLPGVVEPRMAQNIQ